MKRALHFCILLCLIPCYAADITFYSDYAGLVKALNSEKFNDVSEETNYLLLSEIGIPAEVLIVPPRRILKILQDKKPACTFAKLKTKERQEYAIFSLPTDIYQGRLLYQFKQDKPIDASWFNSDGELTSLSGYFAENSQVSLMLSDAMSFSNFFDNEVSKIAAGQKVMRYSSESYAGFLEMFFERRANFILMYPAMISIYTEGQYGDLLRSYRVANSEVYESGQVMCSDTAETRNYIAKVNQALLSLYTRAEFLQAHLHYLPVSSHEKFTKIYHQAVQSFINEASLPKSQ